MWEGEEGRMKIGYEEMTGVSENFRGGEYFMGMEVYRSNEWEVMVNYRIREYELWRWCAFFEGERIRR